MSIAVKEEPEEEKEKRVLLLISDASTADDPVTFVKADRTEAYGHIERLGDLNLPLKVDMFDLSKVEENGESELEALRIWKAAALQEMIKFPSHELAAEFGLQWGDSISEKLPPKIRAMMAENKALRLYKAKQDALAPESTEEEVIVLLPGNRALFWTTKADARARFQGKDLGWLRGERANQCHAKRRIEPASTEVVRLTEIAARIAALDELIKEATDE